MYFSSQILRHSSGDFDDIMLTDVYIFYIFVYTYTCNDMRSVMLQISEYDDESQYFILHCRQVKQSSVFTIRTTPDGMYSSAH